MDYKTNRADHIEDFLVTVRTGQWFGWSDPDNKIYANVIVHDGGSKPTEQECIDGLAQMQSDFDSLSYVKAREKEYPSLGDIADAIFKKEAGDSTEFDALVTKRTTIKNKYTKG